jgi:hypothetical protein
MSTPKENSNGGPRTPQGELRASRNARKHGLLSKEVTFSLEELAEFNHLRNQLWKELGPNTAVREIVCEDIVACAWRMKQALRLEQTEVRRQLKEESERSVGVGVELCMNYPYPMTASELSQRLGFLETVREEIAQHGLIPAKLEKPITQAFGADYWKILEQWNYEPVGRGADISLVLAKLFLDESKVEGQQVSEAPLALEEQQRRESQVRMQMILKLLDVKAQQLQLELHRLRDTQNSCARADRLDLYIRYHIAARREFYSALREYYETNSPISHGSS